MRDIVHVPARASASSHDSTRQDPVGFHSRDWIPPRNFASRIPLQGRGFSSGLAPSMGQIFSPAADTWMRLFLVGRRFARRGRHVFARRLCALGLHHRRDIHPPAQPVPFSHRHHAGELGIDCRYCHTVGRRRPARRPAADPHLHDLPFADLDQRADAGAGARRALPTTSRSNWTSRRGAAGLCVLPSRHPHRQGRRLRRVPRPHRQDGADLPRQAASRWSSVSIATAIPRRICDRPTRSPTWTGSRPAMREARGRRDAAQYGIRVGELTHCYVCHR